MKRIKKFIKFSIFMIVLGLIAVFSMYGYSKASPKLEIDNANNISLYDVNNNLFYQGSGKNEWVPLSDISKNLINSTISCEDKNFYKHFGFDFLRILKALYTNIISGSNKQGASTISQQYAKNLFLEFDKTWERKWNEMWLTLNMETHYSKNEILEGYLNTINYGHGMYGIGNAANFYFNKKASELTLAEAAMLTGIPKSPSKYSPVINLEVAKRRQELVLNSMVKNGYISESEKNEALSEELNIVGKKKESELTTIMYFQDAVLDELKSIDNIPTSFLDTGGLKIYTTFDENAQKSLEDSVQKNLNNDNELQSAGVMMNPNDGSVMALIGGKDFSSSQYNRALNSKRQVGSTMKPFLYYAALENGFTASTTFTSEITTFTFANNKTYSPKNANEIYGNIPISMAAAISYSDNVYAVKTHMFLGEDVLVNMTNRLGIPEKMQAVPSLPLGTEEINILEMTNAYSSFANQGYKVNSHFIKKIQDNNGNVLYEFKDNKDLILNQSLVYILNDLLTTTYDPTFIDYNYPTLINVGAKLKRKYAVKSGTTATDGWTIGYNPDVVTSIWVGYDDNKTLEKTNSSSSKKIWADTMEGYLKDSKEKWYTKPNNVVGVMVEPISGKPASNNSKKKKILYYLKGTEPKGDETVFDEIYTEN